VWKGKRLPDLEVVLAKTIAAQAGVPERLMFTLVDESCVEIAEGPDEWLAYQRSFSVDFTLS